MRYRRSNTLIADSAYDVSWTRMDGRDFHARTPASPFGGQDEPPPGATEEFPWLARGATIVLTSSTPTSVPLLLADNYRNLLIFKNSSFATSPDVAPTLFVNIDGPVQFLSNGVTAFSSAYAFDLAPGTGLVLDTRVLNNAIYVAFAGGSGPTSTAVAAMTYGRTPNSPPPGGGGGPGPAGLHTFATVDPRLMPRSR